MSKEAAVYRDITPVLDRKMPVHMTPQQFSGVRKVLAFYEPDEKDKAAHIALYGQATHHDILLNFINVGARLRQDSEHIVSLPNVLLSRDEQRYIRDMFKQRIKKTLELRDFAGYNELLRGREQFQERCAVANREVDVPENVISLVNQFPLQFERKRRK